jgi:hypothetical protein
MFSSHPYITFIIFSSLQTFFTSPVLVEDEPVSTIIQALEYAAIDEFFFRGLLFEILPKSSILTVITGAVGSCAMVQSYTPLAWSVIIGIGRRNMSLRSVVINRIVFIVAMHTSLLYLQAK